LHPSGQAANTDAKFACASGPNNAKPLVFCNDAGEKNIRFEKWSQKKKIEDSTRQ